MKHKFQDLYDSLKKDRTNSEWSKKHSLETRFPLLRGEVEELGEAIKRGDASEIKDELGDVLWDITACSVIAEEMGMFTLKDVLEHANKKLKRRKPWVFDGKKISIEEEAEKYNLIKNKEKSNNR